MFYSYFKQKISVKLLRINSNLILKRKFSDFIKSFFLKVCLYCSDYLKIFINYFFYLKVNIDSAQHGGELVASVLKVLNHI